MLEKNEQTILKQSDPEVYQAIMKEYYRQQNNIELIASENIVSEAVLEVQGSVLTNKYAEGYPGKRYYGGCEYVDIVEQLAIDRAKALFGAAYANVQPHSGSQANMAVYFGLLNTGDTILGMDLSHGGHLTHGSKVNFSGKLFNVVSYGLDKTTETINYDAILQLAKTHEVKMIVAGASAYSRTIDFEKLRQIADEVKAYLFVDMAHIAGLVASGLHPSPIPYAHVVTTTTHKTLRGPRGGLILSNDEEVIKAVNRTIFPGIQGGPLMHVIAAKAVAFGEALKPEFKMYQQAVIDNAKMMAQTLQQYDFRIVSDKTDNHLMLIDLTNKEMTGKDAEQLLDSVGITCNKNTIPYEQLSPFITSGIRIGSPAITARGFKKQDAKEVAEIIALVIDNRYNEEKLTEARQRVAKLVEKYPLYVK